MRPRLTFDDFELHERLTRIDEAGRQRCEYKSVGLIRGCISSTDSFEREKFGGMKHDNAIRIIQRGGSEGHVGDLLVRLDRKYLIAHVELPPDGWRIYHCTERNDL